MTKLFLQFIIPLLLLSPLHARIGETIQETERRYGKHVTEEEYDKGRLLTENEKHDDMHSATTKEIIRRDSIAATGHPPLDYEKQTGRLIHYYYLFHGLRIKVTFLDGKSHSEEIRRELYGFTDEECMIFIAASFPGKNVKRADPNMREWTVSSDGEDIAAAYCVTTFCISTTQLQLLFKQEQEKQEKAVEQQRRKKLDGF